MWLALLVACVSPVSTEPAPLVLAETEPRIRPPGLPADIVALGRIRRVRIASEGDDLAMRHGGLRTSGRKRWAGTEWIDEPAPSPPPLIRVEKIMRLDGGAWSRFPLRIEAGNRRIDGNHVSGRRERPFGFDPDDLVADALETEIDDSAKSEGAALRRDEETFAVAWATGDDVRVRIFEGEGAEDLPTPVHLDGVPTDPALLWVGSQLLVAWSHTPIVEGLPQPPTIQVAQWHSGAWTYWPSPSGASAREPSLALHDGRPHVAWSEMGRKDGSRKVHTRVWVDDHWSRLGPEDPGREGIGAPAYGAKLAVDDAGRVAIGWVESAGPASGTRIGWWRPGGDWEWFARSAGSRAILTELYLEDGTPHWLVSDDGYETRWRVEDGTPLTVDRSVSSPQSSMGGVGRPVPPGSRRPGRPCDPDVDSKHGRVGDRAYVRHAHTSERSPARSTQSIEQVCVQDQNGWQLTQADLPRGTRSRLHAMGEDLLLLTEVLDSPSGALVLQSLQGATWTNPIGQPVASCTGPCRSPVLTATEDRLCIAWSEEAQTQRSVGLRCFRRN